MKLTNFCYYRGTMHGKVICKHIVGEGTGREYEKNGGVHGFILIKILMEMEVLLYLAQFLGAYEGKVTTPPNKAVPLLVL